MDCFRKDKKWINYLSNGRMHAFVSQAGGGLTWWLTPMLFRITRYRFYNLPIDSPGYFVFTAEKDGLTATLKLFMAQDITRSDDHIWMVYLAYAIAAETGAFLAFVRHSEDCLLTHQFPPSGTAIQWRESTAAVCLQSRWKIRHMFKTG